MTNPNDKPIPPTPTTCPLARDQSGGPIELPAGAAAWRVRRKTGGRPRTVLTVEKQPMQLPLHFTIVDVDDVLAPGAYLLDLVDGKGQPLGVTIDALVGQLRNGDGERGDEDEQTPTIAPMLPVSGSETRLVLEANVRATQMAFQHNQKTLELGLKMAESLREGVQVLAEAQADWIKSVSSARGFFRNAAPRPQLPQAIPEHDDADGTDDDQDDYDDERAPVSTWLDYVGPLVAIAAEKVATTVVSKVMAFGGDGALQLPQLPEALDWRRAARNGQAVRERQKASATETPPDDPKATHDTTAGPALTVDPDAQQHFMAIVAALSDEERRHAQAAAAMLTPNQKLAWMNQLKTVSVEDGVQAIRDAIRRKPAA